MFSDYFVLRPKSCNFVICKKSVRAKIPSRLSNVDQMKKKCVFRVTLPYLIILVKPSNFFMFSQKKNINAEHLDKVG